MLQAWADTTQMCPCDHIPSNMMICQAPHVIVLPHQEGRARAKNEWKTMQHVTSHKRSDQTRCMPQGADLVHMTNSGTRCGCPRVGLLEASAGSWLYVRRHQSRLTVTAATCLGTLIQEKGTRHHKSATPSPQMGVCAGMKARNQLKNTALAAVPVLAALNRISSGDSESHAI